MIWLERRTGTDSRETEEDSAIMKLAFGSHLPVHFWSGGGRTLDCTLCHVATSWRSPGTAGRKSFESPLV